MSGGSDQFVAAGLAAIMVSASILGETEQPWGRSRHLMIRLAIELSAIALPRFHVLVSTTDSELAI